MLADPALLWKQYQEFLNLPQYDMPDMTKIHKAMSSGNPFDYMNQAQLERMRANSEFKPWSKELTDGLFFQKEPKQWDEEFAAICSHYKDSTSVLHWSGSRCVKGQVVPGSGH